MKIVKFNTIVDRLNYRIIALTLPAFLLLCLPLSSQNKKTVLHEDFNDMVRWEKLTFPKVARHTAYQIIKHSEGNCLESLTDNSASAMVYRKKFNIYDYPQLEWRWRISNTYQKGDAKKRSGDDYPIRLYIIFDYDPEQASLLTKGQYNLLKLIYGHYPPHSGLNYIWSSRYTDTEPLPNPYTPRSMMYIKDSGNQKLGEWKRHTADILKDYRRAFGEKPPPLARIAVMSDSDNTGEKATACIDYIKINSR